jgi:hypothetical protein
MKWKKIVVVNILFSLFLLNRAVAQPLCNDAIIMNVKSKWIEKSNTLAKIDGLPQIIKRIDAISTFFKTAYPEPTGVEARWYRFIDGAPIIKNGPIPYQFNSLYLAWYCNKNVHQLLLGGETGTWAYTFVNSFGWFISNQYDLLNIKVKGENVYVLPPEKGTWKGYPIYEASAHGNKSRCIILMHNDQVPWKPITQQQYLQGLRNFWEKQKQDADDSYIKQEKDIKKMIAGINNSTLKQADKDVIIAGMQKELADLPKRNAANSAKSDEYRNERLSILDKYTRENPSSLQNAAIIDRPKADDFDGRFSTLENGGQLLVTINPGYFNKQLPLYAAQLIVLYWRWDNDAPALNFKKQLEENFPVDKLKAMLDK